VSRVGRLAAALLCALLSACASVAPGPVAADLLSGRLSVQVEGDARRSFSAAFELEGSAAEGRLTLTSPLGTQVANAEWSAGRVRLRSSDGERLYPDLDSLAADALGEPVPLAALFDWLRGRAWPGAPSAPAVGGFAQLGWSVDLSQQAEGRIEARRASSPAVVVRARLDGS